MKLYLVTGGAGFIRSHIAETLIARGARVRVLDNLSTGKRKNIPEGAELVEADITDLESIRSAFASVDGVFHCAALPRVQDSIERPLETHGPNIKVTLNVLLAARDAGENRRVDPACPSAYGHQAQLPQPDTF